MRAIELELWSDALQAGRLVISCDVPGGLADREDVQGFIWYPS